jgi:3-dehydroquinate synthase
MNKPTRLPDAQTTQPIIVNVGLGERAYDIAIGRGVLDQLGSRIRALRPGARVAIVTDRTVAEHWLKRAEASLAAAEIPTSRIVVGEGEASKTYRVLEEVCEALVAARIERNDLVIALGGGVIGDLAGFAAVDRPARRRFRAGADLAAGAGRFLRRRQDRHQLAARQEPHRRVPSAGARHRRYGRARYAVAASVPRRLRRSGEIRRCSVTSAFFDWLEANQAPRFSQAARRASTPSPQAAAQRPRS